MLDLIESKKGEGQRLSPFFSSIEFDCRCSRADCTTTRVSRRLLDALETLRDEVGIIVITSGYRCVEHNVAEGGTRTGTHTRGEAADIRSPRFSGQALAKLAESIPAFRNGGIGTYKNLPRIAHVDVRTNGPARWCK